MLEQTHFTVCRSHAADHMAAVFSAGNFDGFRSVVGHN